MNYARDYEKLQARHAELDARSKEGDLGARAEKARVALDAIAVRRAAARAGILVGTNVPNGTQAATKADLQRDYVKRLDDETPVLLADGAGGEKKETTIRAWSRRRLGI